MWQAASSRFSRRPVLSGLLYGGAVYLFMNFVVLPLSRVPAPAGCGDACFTNQRRVGPFALHRIDYFASGAQELGASTVLCPMTSQILICRLSFRDVYTC
jgi:hypothetical protein